MWGGDGDWFDDRAHEDATWAGGGEETELGSHAPWRGTADILDVLPDRRRTAELPGQGLYGTSGDENGDEDTFYSPACMGYCGPFGGGKTPLPTVLPMRHAGPLECSEWEAPFHHPVQQGGGAEAKASGGGVTTVEIG